MSAKPLVKNGRPAAIFLLSLAFLHACVIQSKSPVSQATHTDTPLVPAESATTSVATSPTPDWQVHCDPSPQIADANYVMPLQILFGRWNSMTPFTPEPGYTYYDGLMLMGFNGKAEPKTVEARNPAFRNASSPDGMWLAYDAYDPLTQKSSLYLARTDGSQVQVISWNEEWAYVEKWLLDGRLLIVSWPGYVILDPRTLREEFVSSDFPNAVDFFNAQGTHAVFFNGIHISVYDLNTGKSRLIPDLITGARGNFATWSPDGSHFAVFANFSIGDYTVPPRELSGLYVVDAKGIYEQINSYYGETPFWSPDGRFIAFRYSNPPNIPDFTVLYDVMNKKEIRFCDGYTFSYDNVVWSPDGRYMIARSPLQNGGNWAIINIETGKTVIIPDTRYTKIYSIANAP